MGYSRNASDLGKLMAGSDRGIVSMLRTQGHPRSRDSHGSIEQVSTGEPRTKDDLPTDVGENLSTFFAGTGR